MHVPPAPRSAPALPAGGAPPVGAAARGRAGFGQGRRALPEAARRQGDPVAAARVRIRHGDRQARLHGRASRATQLKLGHSRPWRSPLSQRNVPGCSNKAPPVFNPAVTWHTRQRMQRRRWLPLWMSCQPPPTLRLLSVPTSQPSGGAPTRWLRYWSASLAACPQVESGPGLALPVPHAGRAYAGCTLLQRAAPLALKFVRLLLPPPAGTQVAGCSGRGIFGILPGGEPAEIDPSTRQPGISLLLGRVPGARAHAFSCKRPEGARAGGARGVGVAPL